MPKVRKKFKFGQKKRGSSKKIKNETSDKANSLADAREAQIIKDLAQKFCTPLPHEELTEVSESLREEFDLEDIAELDAKKLWEAVEGSENYLVIEKSSDLHKKAASFVWKVFNFITGSEENFLAYIPQVLARAGINKITAKFDPLIATFRSVIKTDDRRVASSGAQAIRWAMHKKQTPDTIHKYPGGLDSWAREWQTLSRTEKAAAGGKVKPKLTTAATKLVKLRKELKDGDKALLMIKKKGPKLVSEGYRKLPKGKKKYWPLIDAAIGKAK